MGHWTPCGKGGCDETAFTGQVSSVTNHCQGAPSFSHLPWGLIPGHDIISLPAWKMVPVTLGTWHLALCKAWTHGGLSGGKKALIGIAIWGWARGERGHRQLLPETLSGCPFHLCRSFLVLFLVTVKTASHAFTIVAVSLLSHGGSSRINWVL